MTINALEDLFLQELNELYDAEKQVLKALPKMAKAAFSSQLRTAFETHYKETKVQVLRLEKVYKIMGEEPTRPDSQPVSGVIAQGKQMIGAKHSDPAVLDAGLITIAQKVEHYEIAGYGCVRTHAAILGYGEIAELLADTLQEEEKTDRLLTEIATSLVNVEAAKAPYSHARTSPRGAIKSQKYEKDGSSFGTILTGLTIGAVVAILFAPKSGKDTRTQLASKTNEGKDYLKQRGTEISQSTQELIDRGRQAIAGTRIRENERAY